MKRFTRGFALALVIGSLIGTLGCEDNEKASGIASAPTSNEGGGASMTPEEYAKKQSSAIPSGYPNAKKATKSSGAAPK